MAKWEVTPETEGNTMWGGIQYDGDYSNWSISQDINPVLEEAAKDRDSGDGKSHYTKMYSIPEIVAIELKQNWGIDIFSQAFMHDPEMKMKVHLIIQQDYPYLMSTDKRV